jgi:dihydroneopterin triphosphate diphosphatase
MRALDASRAPFQVLIFPYTQARNGGYRYAIFRRAPEAEGYWQGLGGGGEIGESPLEAAKREAYEEAGIDPVSNFLCLASMTTIPVVQVSGFQWGRDLLVIPEYSFGAEVFTRKLVLSPEHTHYRWLSFTRAFSALRWDSNKNALWELDFRLRTGP